jgi:hypothetical protein
VVLRKALRRRVRLGKPEQLAVARVGRMHLRAGKPGAEAPLIRMLARFPVAVIPMQRRKGCRSLNFRVRNQAGVGQRMAPRSRHPLQSVIQPCKSKVFRMRRTLWAAKLPARRSKWKKLSVAVAEKERAETTATVALKKAARCRRAFNVGNVS